MAAGHAARAERTHPLSGVTVLVIDDLPVTLELMESVLGDAGAIVRATSRADDGLRILLAEPIDAVLCDLRMPNVDGHQWVRNVRALLAPEKAGIPAIAMSGTAADSFHDCFDSTVNGFDYHLVKPFRAEILIAQLVRLVGAARAKRRGGARPTRV